MKKLILKSDNKIILEDLRTAYTFFSRFRGLQFRFDLPQSQGLHICPCDSIHMCNMFFKIDAVFVDSDLKIVAVKENLRPWISLVFPVKGAHSVIEIKAGLSRIMGLEPGQQLEITGD